MNTMESLQEIFRIVFDDATLRISRDQTANDIDGWDSLSHVNLITAVEASFKVRFTQRELLRLKNIGDLHDLIESRLKPEA